MYVCTFQVVQTFMQQYNPMGYWTIKDKKVSINHCNDVTLQDFVLDGTIESGTVLLLYYHYNQLINQHNLVLMADGRTPTLSG
ncbi:Uncharacterised protein [Citrobacter youngae]|uniref:Uncharacterized protein n=1 Tax=Citrobacter youngae TaxID=133448 RepID=A0ABN7GPD5_9ENTR|nr:Uncharacterised protein [Citrobacter youngae]CAC9165698.1 Uncharacterised protein [Citrobacter youngae]